MQIIPWILAAAFAGLAIFLFIRRRPNVCPGAVERLAEEVEGGAKLEDSAPGDPPEILTLRLALARGWRPVSWSREDPGEQALRGLFRFLVETVLPPLNAALADGEFRPRVEDAANALKDLAFFARCDRNEKVRTENLSSLVRSVTRDYTLETGVPVRFSGPSGAVPVHLQPEGFRDVVYLILVNAGRFGGGQTVDVFAEEDGADVRLRVRDRGPGFGREALERAFEPFWSSDSDALGLGLTHARRVVGAQGGKIRLQNLEEGDAEVEIVLRRAH
ncbi:MAG: HAMP domain-containing histidine kinase [Gemmatimonadetes bacterium]|nr:HAMP domain-containing histidine kinase [Gemmatimonadota bacterium]